MNIKYQERRSTGISNIKKEEAQEYQISRKKKYRNIKYQERRST